MFKGIEVTQGSDAIVYLYPGDKPNYVSLDIPSVLSSIDADFWIAGSWVAHKLRFVPDSFVPSDIDVFSMTQEDFDILIGCLLDANATIIEESEYVVTFNVPGVDCPIQVNKYFITSSKPLQAYLAHVDIENVSSVYIKGYIIEPKHFISPYFTTWNSNICGSKLRHVHLPRLLKYGLTRGIRGITFRKTHYSIKTKENIEYFYDVLLRATPNDGVSGYEYVYYKLSDDVISVDM